MKKDKKVRIRRSQAGALDLSKMRKLLKLTLLFGLLALGSTAALALWALYQGATGLRTEDTTLLPLKQVLGILPFLAAIPAIVFAVLTMKQESGGDKGNKLWTVAFITLAVCLSYLLFFPVGYLHFRFYSSVGPLTVQQQVTSPDGSEEFIIYDVPRFRGPVRELWVKNLKTGEKHYLVDVANCTPMPQEIIWGQDGKTIVIQYKGRKRFEVDVATGEELHGKTLPYDPNAEALEQLRKKVHDKQQPAKGSAPSDEQPAPPAPAGEPAAPAPAPTNSG